MAAGVSSFLLKSAPLRPFRINSLLPSTSLNTQGTGTAIRFDCGALLTCKSQMTNTIRFWMLHKRHASSVVESDAHRCFYQSSDDAFKNLAAIFLEKCKGCPPALNALLALNDLFQPRLDSSLRTQPCNHAI